MPGVGPAGLLLSGACLPGGTVAIDVHIRSGLIVAVVPTGIDPALDDAAQDGPTVEVVDLTGRFLTPGLWDNHVHFTKWAELARRLDLTGATSAAEAAGLVKDWADAHPGGEPIVGAGFRDGLWPDAPHRDMLDAVAGDRPVVLVSGDLHSTWLNSVALAEYGFADDPTGLLREGDCFSVHTRLPSASITDVDSWAHDAAEAAARRGVVGIVDLEMDWNLGTWQRRLAAREGILRVQFGVYPQDLDRAIAEELATGNVVPGTDGLLTVGPFKVITDGSLNTRTAYCFDEYPGLNGHEHPRGMLTVTPGDLVTLLSRAVAAGFRPAVHAIGDHANSLALDAFEAVGAQGSIEHAQLLVPSDYPRFRELGVIASVQPEHAMDDRDVADRFWAGRNDRAFALRSLLAAGATLALGSDAPVAPLDPWITLAAAVGRTRDDREPWHGEQAISIEEGLAASARTTIAVGQPADIVVLDIDPHRASLEQLRRMPVAATLIAGRFTHREL